MDILVVDDSFVIRQAIKHQLKAAGFEAIAVKNGEEALQELEKRRFDLVLLDWLMPKLDGLETLRHIRAEPQTAYLPVIMVTSESEREYILEALSAGATDYIIKPFSNDVLTTKVREIESQKHTLATAPAAPAGLPPQLLQAFRTSTLAVLEKYTALPIKQVSDALYVGPRSWLDIASIMTLSGGVIGVAVLTLSADLANGLVSALLEDEVETEAERVDGVGELLNTIVSRVQSTLAGTQYSFELSTPERFQKARDPLPAPVLCTPVKFVFHADRNPLILHLYLAAEVSDAPQEGPDEWTGT